jgi:hypothetical protein
MVEPSFLALTRTPSMSPSSAEDTLPLRVCACGPIVVRPTRSPAKLTVAKSLLNIISSLPPQITRMGSANINCAKLIPATDRRCLPPRLPYQPSHDPARAQGHTNPAGRITAHDKLLLQSGRSGKVPDRGLPQPAIGDQEIAIFAEAADRHATRAAVTHRVQGKVRCQAGGAPCGNALFTLLAPLPRITLPERCSKSPAHDLVVNEPSCAGRESSTRGVMSAGVPRSRSHGHACRLWASAPVAKPPVPLLTHRIREALAPILSRSAPEGVSLCRNRGQQGYKYRHRCCRNRELTHFRLPQFSRTHLGLH